MGQDAQNAVGVLDQRATTRRPQKGDLISCAFWDPIDDAQPLVNELNVRREIEVACSPKTQPAWFRIAKYALLLPLTVIAWRQGWLGPWLWAIGGAAFALHLTYRVGTRAWTRSWGGWTHFPSARR